MSEQPSKDPKLDPNRQWEADFEERATRTSNDLLSLLRFRVLDYRNATEEARERLMLEAADEIERLRAALQRITDYAQSVEDADEIADRALAGRATDETPALLAMGDPIPEGGCGCRQNGVPLMRANCRLHGATGKSAAAHVHDWKPQEVPGLFACECGYWYSE